MRKVSSVISMITAFILACGNTPLLLFSALGFGYSDPTTVLSGRGMDNNLLPMFLMLIFSAAIEACIVISFILSIVSLAKSKRWPPKKTGKMCITTGILLLAAAASLFLLTFFITNYIDYLFFFYVSPALGAPLAITTFILALTGGKKAA